MRVPDAISTQDAHRNSCPSQRISRRCFRSEKLPRLLVLHPILPGFSKVLEDGFQNRCNFRLGINLVGGQTLRNGSQWNQDIFRVSLQPDSDDVYRWNPQSTKLIILCFNLWKFIGFPQCRQRGISIKTLVNPLKSQNRSHLFTTCPRINKTTLPLPKGYFQWPE